jgi:hypothetical protein
LLFFSFWCLLGLICVLHFFWFISILFFAFFVLFSISFCEFKAKRILTSDIDSLLVHFANKLIYPEPLF